MALLPRKKARNTGEKTMHEKIKAGLRAGIAGLLRHAGIKRCLKRMLGRAAPAVRQFINHPMDQTILSSIADVDRFLDGMRVDFTELELREYWDRHQANRRALFGPDAVADPHSEEYLAQVVREYSILSGRTHDAYENERTPSIDMNIHLARPFPYNMKRPSVAVSGLQYTLARVFSLVSIEEGQRLIEFGSGWGNAIFQFAQAGALVTMVDIEENFLALAQERFRRLGMPIECLHGEFNDVELPPGHYEYAFFMQAFHHCINHPALLRKIHRALTDEGRIIFCGEPIHPEFEVPWGIRLDGESLWAIRRNGWFELGFQETYFRACLHAAGFVVRKHVFAAERSETIWVARKARPGAGFFDYAAENEAFHAPEDSHLGRVVFAASRCCSLPLPSRVTGAQLVLPLVNFLPVNIRVHLATPSFETTRTFAPGQAETIRIPEGAPGQHIKIETELFVPPSDPRMLGIAILENLVEKGV